MLLDLLGLGFESIEKLFLPEGDVVAIPFDLEQDLADAGPERIKVRLIRLIFLYLVIAAFGLIPLHGFLFHELGLDELDLLFLGWDHFAQVLHRTLIEFGDALILRILLRDVLLKLESPSRAALGGVLGPLLLERHLEHHTVSDVDLLEG